MKIFKYIKTVSLIAITAFMLTTSSVYIEEVSAAQQQTLQSQNALSSVDPLKIVNSPKAYLDKNVIIKGKFDKFSTLGLDYKFAYKSSDEYISFLIKRNDTKNSIPLSELKLFLKRDVAEKFIDLKSDDEIEINGLVFSDALGDAWVDVSKITILKKVAENDKDGDK